MRTESSTAADPHTGSELAAGRTSRLAPLFVVLSLVAILLAPLLVQSTIREVREEVEAAADPARTIVTRIQYLLARQTSALRGYLISGDSTYLRQYEEFSRLEAESHELLEPLARRLGTEVFAQFTEMRTLSRRWHEEVEEELPGIRARVRGGEIPFEREDYLQTLVAASRFDQSVVTATLQRQDLIRRAESRLLLVQAALVGLALLAALATAQLGARARRLAQAAEFRRREAEQALAATARVMEAKSRLLRGVTHDVKNPLGAADGYAELLEMGLRGEITPAQAQMVAGIRRGIHGALAIIQDLIEIAGAETGDLSVQEVPVELTSLVRGCVEEYQGAADAAGHRISLDLPDGPIQLCTDPLRVGQILGNVLSNAVKYSPRGGHIQVSVERRPEGDGSVSWAVVSVRDTGPGVPDEYRDRIFEEFERVPGTSAAGHGLGLAIARRVARLLGGDLILASAAGTGSTFSLRLPLHPPG